MSFERNLSFEAPNNLKKESQDRKIEDQEGEERLEKIEIVATRLKEKYNEYQNFSYFIDYLASMERISVLSEIEKQGKENIKKSFIDAESHLMSLDSGIDKEIFDKIKEDFADECETLDGIEKIANKLKNKHEDCSGCVDFIEYMKDSLILMSNLSEKSREKIMQSRMRIISNNTNGNPSLTILQKAYDEFKEELEK